MMINGGNQLSMAILALLERGNCQRPSSEIVFRHLQASELPESRASADPRCVLWGRRRTALSPFFLAHRSLLFSSETSVVSEKYKQAEFILPVRPAVLYVRPTMRLAELIAIQPSLPSPCQCGF